MSFLWLSLLCVAQGAYYALLRKRLRITHQLTPDEPREEPPLGLSAATLRYIWRRHFDSDCVIASLLSAAVQNIYFISWQTESFTARRNPIITLADADEELRFVFGVGDGNFAEHVVISRTRNRFTDYIEEKMRTFLRKNYGQYFLRPYKWVLWFLPIQFLLLFIAPLWWQLLFIGIHALGLCNFPRYTAEGSLIADAIQQFRSFLAQRVATQKPFEEGEYYLLPYLVALEIDFAKSEYFKPLMTVE